MKIALTSVYVPNPSEAFTFYTEVLGFVKRRCCTMLDDTNSARPTID
jgi:hypothetical protein